MENSKTKIGLGLVFLLLAAFVMFNLSNPELGSDAWCRKLADTRKVEWTAEDVKNFTFYCVGRNL